MPLSPSGVHEVKPRNMKDACTASTRLVPEAGMSCIVAGLLAHHPTDRAFPSRQVGTVAWCDRLQWSTAAGTAPGSNGIPFSPPELWSAAFARSPLPFRTIMRRKC